ncbi:hypothetical protein KY285_016373 [Solanum tuberosum]|nr:hypothetical protein KY284_016365 [Solanum tuberosum]KAH0702095.1 hypothetical protein KY285_016373 [Solanum tuberosum]
MFNDILEKHTFEKWDFNLVEQASSLEKTQGNAKALRSFGLNMQKIMTVVIENLRPENEGILQVLSSEGEIYKFNKG